MRMLAISLLALAPLTGCLSLHATLPEDAVRRHIAQEDGVELGAICSLEGRSFSEGAIACMAEQRMTCDASGRWVRDGGC